MKLVHFLFLFSITAMTQNPAIELKIDSISSFDSIPTARIFTINYHIENLTDKEVSFLSTPKSLIPNSVASMSKKVIYKIFQNNEIIDIGNIFGNRSSEKFEVMLKNAKTEEEKTSIILQHRAEIQKLIKIDYKTETEAAAKDENYYLNKEKQQLLSEILTLKAHEKLSFSSKLLWDTTRYFKIDDNEFYLDEKTPHYIEFSINLMKEEFKSRLEPENYKIIEAIPNLIKGWYTSNRVEINFNE